MGVVIGDTIEVELKSGLRRVIIENNLGDTVHLEFPDFRLELSRQEFIMFANSCYGAYNKLRDIKTGRVK
jgi:hypothetical protein